METSVPSNCSAHARVLMLVALIALFGVNGFAQGSPSAGTTPFVLDGNRMYAELDFLRPDGSVHKALAFVDMGSQYMTLRESLFRALQLDQNKPLVFRVGGLSVEVRHGDVVSERREPSSLGSDLKVEGMLPASILVTAPPKARRVAIHDIRRSPRHSGRRHRTTLPPAAGNRRFDQFAAGPA